MLENSHIKNIHCLGIGGIGVSALAEILLRKGYCVSGSDISHNDNTERLQALGIDIAFDHDSDRVSQADCVVYSSAISDDNPEWLLAKKANIPMLKRGQLLAEVMKSYCAIAVAGAHGKTTTSGLLAHTFIAADLDPTFLVGGVLNEINTPARVGNGDYFIAEADESDASFLYMHPDIVIITSIDPDHLGTYGGDFEQLKKANLQFIEQMPEDGVAVLCLDDPIIRELLPSIKRRMITYGFSDDADFLISDYHQQGIQAKFTVQGTNVLLNMPGKHNVLNAVAVMAVADLVNMDRDKLLKSLADFSGVNRRFTFHGNIAAKKGTALLIEDYGHHPNEVKAMIQAARATWPNRRIVMAFQPHRYTRTRDLMTEFAEALAGADVLLLTDIYPASESPIEGVNIQALAQQMVAKGPLIVPSLKDVPQALQNILQPDDIVILQGAGDIGTVVKYVQLLGE